MNNETLIKLIGEKATDNSIRSIINNIEIKTDKGVGLFPGIIYFIVFKTLSAVYRRVYDEVNPETLLPDNPISIKYSNKDQFIAGSYEGYIKTQILNMNQYKQTMIIVCIEENDEVGFIPILSGVFNLNK